MKVKMLVAAAMATLLAASFAGATAVTNNDGTTSKNVQTQLVDDMSGASGTSAPMSGTSSSMSGANSLSGVNTGDSSATDPNSNSNEDLNADTATGDDDY